VPRTAIVFGALSALRRSSRIDRLHADLVPPPRPQRDLQTTVGGGDRLAKVYGKLAVRSRTELALLLAQTRTSNGPRS